MRFPDHLKFWLQYLNKNDLSISIELTGDEQVRIDMYCKPPCKKNTFIKYGNPANSFSKIHKTGYAYDWHRIIDKSETRNCHTAFKDIAHIFDEPTFCKSRPISEKNQNNVLLPLDSLRHLTFHQDKLNLSRKHNKAVFRGAVYQPHRKQFLTHASKINICDVADTGNKAQKNILGHPKHFLSVKDQLNYKMIFAIEGFDVASNLKWIMGSNSIPVMPKPKMETWFLESRLKPNQHFLEISDDFLDIEEVVTKAISEKGLLEYINEESKKYANDFKDIKRQYQLARVVIERYFNYYSSL